MQKKPLLILAGAIVAIALWTLSRSGASENANNTSPQSSQTEMLQARVESLEQKCVNTLEIAGTIKEQQVKTDSQLKQLSSQIDLTKTSPRREEFDKVVANASKSSTLVQEISARVQTTATLDELAVVRNALNKVMANDEEKLVEVRRLLSQLITKVDKLADDGKKSADQFASIEVQSRKQSEESLREHGLLAAELKATQDDLNSLRATFFSVIGSCIMSGLDVAAVPNSQLICVQSGSAISHDGRLLSLREPKIISVNIDVD
ncbi:MAG TPA: hypothetical protein PLY87_28775 [Planctomycetaceae bacterium]|nr:hypothetical protein [Planctomycetaceae bacterium]